mgnify:CR=1 FL=1
MKNKFISFFTQRRKELGYSQSKIANELGISDQAVSNWERGITFPDLSYLSDVARVLNTNVLSLITGKHKNINIKKNINFDVKRFSFYLSKLRKNKQLTQNELGKILGVSGQNISKFENGVFLPSIELLEKYVKYFNVSFLNIYYGLEDNELYENHHINTKTNRLKWVIILAVVFSILLMFIFIPTIISKKHQVTIILDEGTVLTYRIKDQGNITLPNLPTKKGYESSWDNTDTLITSDKTYRVIYTPKKYTITYQFEDNLIEEFSQEVVYGEEFTLYAPYVNDYTFIGYIYNNEIIKNGIYEYDCDITIYGQFTKETFTIDCVFANSTHHFSQTGYGGAFTFGELQLNEFISECPYARGEYANYKISAWKDTNGNIYEVGKTYIYNFKRDIVVCPVFEYYGDAFEVEITNGKAKIIKYNISKITTLIIPDYIIINGVKYQVTEIAENTFQDIYFINISFSSNVTKIYKNTFSDEGLENNTLTKGSIYFNGTLFDWFNIDFEEAIASKKAKAYMDLYLSTFLVDSIYANNSILKIPEGVKVISSYSLANLIVREVIIPNSVHTIEAHAFKNSNISLITNIENVENVSEEAFK